MNKAIQSILDDQKQLIQDDLICLLEDTLASDKLDQTCQIIVDRINVAKVAIARINSLQ